MKPLVSFVIVNWNGLKYLRDCLDSLLAQTYDNLEIVLVDNASTDGSVDFVRKNYPSVRVVQNDRNLGFAEGTNIGISHSRGELIALFNQDAIARRDWLAILTEKICSSGDIAAVSGKIFFWRGSQDSTEPFCTWAKVNPTNARAYNYLWDEPMADVDYLSGCAMLITRKALDEIGLLDSDYFLYYEETDWCARAIRAGYRLVYVPDAVAWHVAGAIENSQVKMAYLVRNRARFALKNFDAAFLPAFTLSFISDTLHELAGGYRKSDYGLFRIYLGAAWWNLVNIPGTFLARRRALARIKSPRSYNRSLPLRDHPWNP